MLAQQDHSGGVRVCPFESVQGKRQWVLQYDWGHYQMPHLSKERRNVARTRGAARCNPPNCGTYWTDWLYPFLEVLDLLETDQQTWSGRNDAGGSSPLGSFLCSDAKHHLTYIVPTLSFVCDSNSMPTVRPRWIARSARPCGGSHAPLSRSGAVDAFHFVIAASCPNMIQFSLPGRLFWLRNLLLRGCEQVLVL